MRLLLLAAVLALLLAAPARAGAPAPGGAVTIRSALEGDFDIREDFRTTVRWLVYTAAPGHANRLRVRFHGRRTTLTDPAGIKARTGCEQRTRTRVVCTQRGAVSAEHHAAVLALGDGDDELRMRGVSRDGSTAVRPGAGDDVVRGSAGADTITGGAGDDRLAGRDGDDAIGAGAAPDGADRMHGGRGDDLVAYPARSGAVHADLAGDADDGEAGERDRIGRDVERLRGGAGADDLAGDDRDNRLDGGAGADRLAAGGGADRLSSAGDGAVLDGGPGEDAIEAGGGAARIDGGPGRDGIADTSGEAGAPSVVAARDGAADEIACVGAGDGVTADAPDLVVGCGALDRTGSPVGRLLLALGPYGGLSSGPFARRLDRSSDDTVSIPLGCPQDMGRPCRLRVELQLGGRRLLRTGVVAVDPGGLAEAEGFMSRARFRRARLRTVVARVATADRDGAQVLQREEIRVRRDPYGF